MGAIRGARQDITMMTMLNSKERTLSEFVEIGQVMIFWEYCYINCLDSKNSGLEFVKIWESGEGSLLEFSPMAQW
jgi:hypothetical protein